jgi:hypothetical protein
MFEIDRMGDEKSGHWSGKPLAKPTRSFLSTRFLQSCAAR